MVKEGVTMPWESIGSVSTGDLPEDEAWILWCLRFAKKYIELVNGDPPLGCNLDIMHHEHELGEYPSLGVWYEYEQPSDYIIRCELSLDVINDAISWDELQKHFYDSEDIENDDIDDYEDET
jgi:hypothetical protein